MKHKHKLKSERCELISYWYAVEIESKKICKLLQIVLSALTVLLFMFICYRIGVDTSYAIIETQQQEIEQLKQDYKYPVERVEEQMRRFIPKEDKRKKEAIIFVGKTRAFEIPLRVAMVSAEAETCYNMQAVGPFGERGTHQATYATMRKYFPNCNGDLIYWEVASWMHLRESFEKSGRDLFLTLAYHNAGCNWFNRNKALYAARKHISRCRRIARGLSV